MRLGTCVTAFAPSPGREGARMSRARDIGLLIYGLMRHRLTHSLTQARFLGTFRAVYAIKYNTCAGTHVTIARVYKEVFGNYHDTFLVYVFALVTPHESERPNESFGSRFNGFGTSPGFQASTGSQYG